MLLLGRRRQLGGLDKAVPNVDVVVEVAVVLIDSMDGGDSLAAVEGLVPVEIHGGVKAPATATVNPREWI